MGLRPVRRLLPGLLTGLLAGLLAGLLGAGPVAAAPAPVVWDDHVGDPSVIRTPRGLVIVATGPEIGRLHQAGKREWTWVDPALTRRPSWSRRGDIWAADVARLGRRYVLYYAAPVRGLGENGRCIGVAVARTPLERFRPVGRAPLVCPSGARTPAAADPVADGVPGLPKKGVIDPSLYVEGGQPHLLYKTDGVPSSIRILPLTGDGLSVLPGATSSTLLDSPGVVENPVVVRRPEGYYLFLSEDDYSRCSYRTTWLRSTSLTDWSAATAPPVDPAAPPAYGVLLDQAGTGLCGPGGADVLVEGDRATVYFHGWTCRHSRRPCDGPRFKAFHRGGPTVRALYAARLTFTGGVPTIARYL